MRVNKITGRWDHIDVDFGDRSARLIGELLVNGFAVLKNGFKEWSDGKPITEAEKEEIKRAVNEYMKDKKLKVIFD